MKIKINSELSKEERSELQTKMVYLVNKSGKEFVGKYAGKEVVFKAGEAKPFPLGLAIHYSGQMFKESQKSSLNDNPEQAGASWLERDILNYAETVLFDESEYAEMMTKNMEDKVNSKKDKKSVKKESEDTGMTEELKENKEEKSDDIKEDDIDCSDGSDDEFEEVPKDVKKPLGRPKKNK